MKRIKSFNILLIDMLLINIAFLFSFYMRFSIDISYEIFLEFLKIMPFIVMLYIIPFYMFRAYKVIWNLATMDEVVIILISCVSGGILNLFFIPKINSNIEFTVITMATILIFILTLGIRMSYRVYKKIFRYLSLLNNGFRKRKKVLVIGAGYCGRLVIEEFKKYKCEEYKVIGLIDDNKNKIKTYLGGIKVLGTRYNIEEIVANKNIELIIIAIPSLGFKDKKEIIEICYRTKAKVKIMPSIYELIQNEINVKSIRNVDLKDLLGREEVVLDKEGIKEYIENKVVLVTGGGGSIGCELCRQIAKFSPKILLILDIYENNAYELENELSRSFKNLNKQVLIASVRDRNRMDNIFKKYKPQIIFHAAAHKHVPLMEFNPGEAIKNNVMGTLNVAECSKKYNSEIFVFISTDKAVNPTNVMGASKRLCEMIIQAIDNECNTEFVAVRFGNVLGSNGSVIPLFKKQIKDGGPITLTNKKVTRYFMLIPEAAQLVLQAGAYAKGGEIFVLDMGEPVKIYDLAKRLIRLSGLQDNKDIKIEVTGLRPGEKLYEELLMLEEALKETKHSKIFIGKSGKFDLKILKSEINLLLELSKLGDKEGIKLALQKIVPTYKRLDSINEVKTSV